MKQTFLFLAALCAAAGAHSQTAIFMKMIENKMICNREDQFTWFLQSNSYERTDQDHYVHYYTEGREQYYVNISNENECYITYRTDNVKDYNRIKTAITNACAKEYAADKLRTASCICNSRRVQDVQIIFAGYSQEAKAYDIKVFQNPSPHQVPYAQSDRVAPGYDK